MTIHCLHLSSVRPAETPRKRSGKPATSFSKKEGGSTATRSSPGKLSRRSASLAATAGDYGSGGGIARGHLDLSLSPLSFPSAQSVAAAPGSVEAAGLGGVWLATHDFWAAWRRRRPKERKRVTSLATICLAPSNNPFISMPLSAQVLGG